MGFLPAPSRNTKSIGALKVTKSQLPKAFAQVLIGALKVTKVSLYSIYSDPASAQVVIGAPTVTKASLFTVIPPLPRW